jgi:hypothetical protein
MGSKGQSQWENPVPSRELVAFYVINESAVGYNFGCVLLLLLLLFGIRVRTANVFLFVCPVSSIGAGKMKWKEEKKPSRIVIVCRFLAVCCLIAVHSIFMEIEFNDLLIIVNNDSTRKFVNRAKTANQSSSLNGSSPQSHSFPVLFTCDEYYVVMTIAGKHFDGGKCSTAVALITCPDGTANNDVKHLLTSDAIRYWYTR